MPKAPKSNSRRKAPSPSDSHDEIRDWIRRTMPDLNPIVSYLDGLIRETVPDAQFAVKWKKAYYGRPDRGWIIELVSYDVSVNIVFLRGENFDTPPPEGSGESRYIKIRSLEEAQQPEIRGWIEEAARRLGWAYP